MDTLIDVEGFRRVAADATERRWSVDAVSGREQHGKTSFWRQINLSTKLQRSVSTAPDFNHASPSTWGNSRHQCSTKRPVIVRKPSRLRWVCRNVSITWARKIHFEAKFSNVQGLPYYTYWASWIDGWRVELDRRLGSDWKVESRTPGLGPPVTGNGTLAEMVPQVFSRRRSAYSTDFNKDDSDHFREIKDFTRRLDRPLAVAPIRTEPKRNYELTIAEFHPQGKHVPVMISQIFGTEQSWEKIAEPLHGKRRSKFEPVCLVST